MSDKLRRIAVIGGSRIPFCRSNSVYFEKSNMDLLAAELGLDAVELRRRNALRVGSATSTGKVLRESAGLVECIDKVDAEMRQGDFRWTWDDGERRYLNDQQRAAESGGHGPGQRARFAHLLHLFAQLRQGHRSKVGAARFKRMSRPAEGGHIAVAQALIQLD